MEMGSWLAAIVPELVLAAAVVVLLPLGPFLPARWKGASTWLALLALLLAAAASLPLLAVPPRAVFGGSYAVDPFAVYFKLVAIAATTLVLLATRESFRGEPHGASAPTMLVLTCLGMVMLAASQNLVLIALFLSLVTVGSYVLAGMARGVPLASEGALKLFLFGSVAVVTMFYGMALLYGLTGALDLPAMARRLPTAPRVVATVALLLVVAGYGFKVTAVPFQFWAPDTYQGAPTPIAAFLSVGPKAAGLAVLLRTLAVTAPGALGAWPSWIAALAAVTMTAGNLLALRQTNLKRLLAYSSIAQAGYLLIGVATYGRDPLAVPAMLVYFAAYLVMNLGAFLAVAAVGARLGSDERGAYRGLGSRMPGVALVLAISLLALAGFPPMGSFVGKVMLFGAAVGAGMTWLAVVAAANTALSLYYYARVLQEMYLAPAVEGDAGGGARAPAPPVWTTVAAGMGALATLLFGIAPGPLLAFAERTAVLLVR